MTTRETRSAWRALPALIVAGLMPKCPLCLLGILTLLGAADLRQQLFTLLSARLLLWSAITLVVLATAWLALRRGPLGGLVGGFAAVLLLWGKHVHPNALLVACGIALLALYLFFGQKRERESTRGQS